MKTTLIAILSFILFIDASYAQQVTLDSMNDNVSPYNASVDVSLLKDTTTIYRYE